MFLLIWGLICQYISLNCFAANQYVHRPIVVNTWPFTDATHGAWRVLSRNGSALDAVEKGCNVAEHNLNIISVGYGGFSDEQGNISLDAMIMDGKSMQAGAVAGLYRIKDAIRVARAVMNFTSHTFLAGHAATEFAKQMGFREESLKTKQSVKIWKDWLNNNCQPNFRKNVSPNPRTSCGPYHSLIGNKINLGRGERVPGSITADNHDTIGMIALDNIGNLAVGTSTCGASHRVPGRVADTAIVGAGGYVDNEIGGAAATGDGDVLMRFLLSYHTVLLMEQGMTPQLAAEKSLVRVKQAGPWCGALVALTNSGEFGGACVGFSKYEISVQYDSMSEPVVVPIPCSHVSHHC